MSRAGYPGWEADPDEIDRLSDAPSWDEGREDEVEPWWERYYDERDDYDGYRDEVER